MSAPRRAKGGRRTFWEWVRHHTTAVLATAVDYTVMVICVELVHLGPVTATPIAAFCGAVTSFALSRNFTFRAAAEGRVGHQVWKFVLVSGASLALNSLGEFVFHNRLGLHYMLARVITSTIVSNGWNYPMLRFFVFSGRSP